MPFDVVLPDNLGSESSTASSPESDAKPVEASSETNSIPKSSSSETTNQVLELDKLEKFRFGGKELSPKDLKNSMLMHADYTRKTQEAAEARKYAENFEADLQKVIQSPARIYELRKIYPPFYIGIAERLLEKMGGSSSATSVPTNDREVPQGNPIRDQKLEFLENKVKSWEEQQFNSEVKSLEAWLDNTYQTLSKKYPFAQDEIISARAEVLARNGNQVDEKVLDKLFRQNNDEIKSSWEKMYKGKVDEQLKAGSKGKDAGTGGGIPGSAPKGFKTIKEATAAFLSDVGAR